MIKVKNLKKTYPGKVPTEALKKASFEIKTGEFIAIMGKSGSGKSTLLHQLGLLDTPTSGEITIDGVDVLKLSGSQQTKFRLEKLGYVFQEYAILAELTALENVYLPLMVNGNSNGQDYKKIATEVLEKVELGHRLDHYTAELSGGEQQRVAIARALVNKPKILFADEPCANLDSESSENILKLLSQLNKDLGQTIIMISHDQDDKKWVERIIWLKDGLIEKTEKVKKLGKKGKK